MHDLATNSKCWYFHVMNKGYSFLSKCFCKRPKQSTSWKKPISKCSDLMSYIKCTVMTLEQVHLYCSISRSFEVYILLHSTKWSVMWCMTYFLLFKIVAGEHPLPVKILLYRLYIIPTNTRTLLWCIHLNYFKHFVKHQNDEEKVEHQLGSNLWDLEAFVASRVYQQLWNVMKSLLLRYIKNCLSPSVLDSPIHRVPKQKFNNSGIPISNNRMKWRFAHYVSHIDFAATVYSIHPHISPSHFTLTITQ